MMPQPHRHDNRIEPLFGLSGPLDYFSLERSCDMSHIFRSLHFDDGFATLLSTCLPYSSSSSILSIVDPRDLKDCTVDKLLDSRSFKGLFVNNQVLGMIRRNITYKEKSLIIPLYKAIVRPHLEYCIQAWNPHLRKDVDMLEKIQRRATKLIPELRDLTYEERLNNNNNNNLFSIA